LAADEAAVVLVAADADGNVLLWSLGADGTAMDALVGRPAWQVRPATQGQPASALAVVPRPGEDKLPLEASCRIAVGFQSEVLVLDGATGATAERFIVSGAALSVRWR